MGMKDVSSVVRLMLDKIEMEEMVLQLASSNQCLEYHTGYLNALKDTLEEIVNAED